MHDKPKELFTAFKAGQMSRRELMSSVAKLGVSAATANFLLQRRRDASACGRFRLEKIPGHKASPSVEQASLRGRDDRGPR